MAKLGREASKRIGRAPKEAMIGELVNILTGKPGYVLCDNKGLTLAQATKFRKTARENKVAIKVIKNKLLAIALDRAGLDSSKVKHLLKGETVIAIGLEDPVSPAKVVVEFAKNNEKLVIKGGYLDGSALTAAAVDGLSKLPSKEELLVRFLSSINSPIQNLVVALNNAVGKPVYMLDAIRRQKEEGGASAA
ncbi:50S ribosomal protein L10 [bacterium]|nr:50S ribosomal protein L10 [bacterium]